MTKEKITVEVFVKVPVAETWKYFTLSEHVTGWNYAGDDWHCPRATNDLQVGGKFCYNMAAKDESFSFDFEGEYTQVAENVKIAYVLADGREVHISFEDAGDATIITEVFDPENENPIELQRQGWQMILNNFKKYAESKHQ